MSKYSEKYEYTLTRTYSDGTVETTKMVMEDESPTHDRLATNFNRFLDSCGYVGHNYVNHRDR